MESAIELILKPDERLMDLAGQQSGNFLKIHGLSDETIQIQVKIIKELIKNGMKYGKFTATENKLTICIMVADDCVTVEVKNPVDAANRNRLKELDKTIQFIRGYQDPREAYIIIKQNFLDHSLHEDAHCLDLIKLAYEAKATIDFYINENNILNQSAVRSLNGSCIN